jgi:soluble lytic murein transglycosylase
MIKKKRRFRVRLFAVMVILIAVMALLWQPLYKNVFLKAAYPEKYQNIVKKYAALSGLDPCLVYAVIRSESSFNPNAESSIGALGLMQVTPSTFEWAMSKTAEKESYVSSDLFTPAVNVRYGTIVLSTLFREFGSEGTAIAAYHAGRGNVKKWLKNSKYSKDGKTLYHIPYKDTRAYVKKVEATQKIYAELYNSKS